MGASLLLSLILLLVLLFIPGAALASTRATLRSDVLDPFSITQDTRTTSTNTPDCASGAACPKLTWTQTYTAADRRIASSSPLGRASTVLLDVVGRPIQTSVPGVLPVTIHYDSVGRVDQVTQGSRTSSTTFDPTTGWATSSTDPLGRVTTVNQRDAVGRVRSVTLPGNRTVFSAYDAAGNVTSITPPGKLPSGLSYTPIDLEATFTPPVAEDGATGTLQSTYNVDRQLTQMSRADGTILATYDFFGRPAAVADSFFTATRTYNAADQVIQLDGNQESLAYGYDGPLLLSTTYTGAISGSVSRVFDNLFRVTQLTAAGVSTAYTYDDDGLLTRAGPVQYTRDLSNGRVTGTQAVSVLDTWGYDAYGAPNHFDARDGSGSLLSLDYTRDNGGRITQITEALLGGAATTTTYDYDAAGRLATVAAGATTTTFAYDQNGNRTHVNGVNVATYDAQDRMLTYGDNAYAYTAGGDLLTKTAPAGTTQYTYDLYGSLRHATLPDGTLLDYTIDPAHRRIGKSRNGVREQGFLYDGIHPVAELDGAGATVSVFQYGARGNVPETMAKAGVNYRFVVDHLGSVRLVVNASTGAVAQALSYDAWGSVTSDSAPGFQPFGYAGGLYDRDLKLVRFGARDYDPETGRFTSKDDAGLGGGTNPYLYALDNPVDLLDATGFGPAPSRDELTYIAGLLGVGETARLINERHAMVMSAAAGDENGVACHGANVISATAGSVLELGAFGSGFGGSGGGGGGGGGQRPLVYGPSAGGKLADYADRIGGQTLTDLEKPVEMSWREFSLQTLDNAAASGRPVVFDVSNMNDVQGVLNGTAYPSAVTSLELRYIQANWGRFENVVQFVGGVPW